MCIAIFYSAQLGVDPDELKEVKEEPRKSRKQMEESRILLTKLVEDQNSLVTNVRVAAHAREGQRRIDEEEAKRLRFVYALIFNTMFLVNFHLVVK